MTMQTTLKPVRKLDMAVPEGASEAYAGGWSYGDWWLSTGGSAMADAPENWSEERCVGFWDRLSAARRAEQAKAVAQQS